MGYHRGWRGDLRHRQYAGAGTQAAQARGGGRGQGGGGGGGGAGAHAVRSFVTSIPMMAHQRFTGSLINVPKQHLHLTTIGEHKDYFIQIH